MKKRRVSWQVLKENWSFVAEDIFLAVFIGFACVGIVSIFSAGDNLSASVKDVAPLFIGLVSVYVAFSVLSMSLEANRKQAKIDRDLTVRPLVQIERFRAHDNWGKLPSIMLRISEEENGFYDAGFDDDVKFIQKPIVIYNSGLGPCYSVVFVINLCGKRFQSINMLSEVGGKERKAVNFMHTSIIGRAECLYSVCKDIYGNHHVVAHFFNFEKGDIRFLMDKYLGNDSGSESNQEADNIINFIKNEGMFFFN